MKEPIPIKLRLKILWLENTGLVITVIIWVLLMWYMYFHYLQKEEEKRQQNIVKITILKCVEKPIEYSVVERDYLGGGDTSVRTYKKSEIQVTCQRKLTRLSGQVFLDYKTETKGF